MTKSACFRLPIAPLLEAAQTLAGGPIDDRSISRMLGLTPTAVSKIRARGHMTTTAADRHATALGLHPAEIWGVLWWQGTDLDEATA